MQLVRGARSGLWFLMGLYLLLSVAALVSWGAQGLYGITGDEPHYLVIADALVRDGTPEVSVSYARELAQANFYAPGLAPAGSALQPPWAHVVQTPAGVFSWHGIGIAALAVIPLSTVGIWGVKAVMLVSGLLVIAAAWRVATWVGLNAGYRTAAVASVALAYPVLLAAGQIYPDLLAGALLLAFLAWLLVPTLRSPGVTTAVSLGIGSLPWLGMKFAVPAVIAALVLIGIGWHRRRNVTFAVAAVVPVVVLGLVLIVVNVDLYGSVLGPPVSGTLAFGREFWMLLPGLLLDQNQGPLFYNPILWLGLAGIGILARRTRLVALVWALLFLSLWIPAAAHPGLYGLGSFNGRYSWPLALLLIVPALLALERLLARSRRGFLIVVTAALPFSAFFFALAVMPVGLSLYTQSMNTWLAAYTFAWFPLQGMLPAWYSATWAFTYGPNWVWLGVGIAVMVLGFFPRLANHARSRVRFVGAIALVVAIALGSAIAFPATSQTQFEPNKVSASPGSQTAGYLAYGPAWPMRLGTYEWFVKFRADGSSVVGKWELVRVADDSVVAAGELKGTQGEWVEDGVTIPFRSYSPQNFVMRIGWYGEAAMTIDGLGVRSQN